MLQDNIIHGTYYEGPPQAQTILVVPLSDAMPTNGLLLVALIDLENDEKPEGDDTLAVFGLVFGSSLVAHQAQNEQPQWVINV